MAKKETVYSLRIEQDLLKEAVECAERESRSTASLVRHAIKVYLKVRRIKKSRPTLK